MFAPGKVRTPGTANAEDLQSGRRQAGLQVSLADRDPPGFRRPVFCGLCGDCARRGRAKSIPPAALRGTYSWRSFATNIPSRDASLSRYRAVFRVFCAG